MKFLRFFLFPFGLIYYAITSLRNYLFDSNIYKSSKFDLPIILVGNLSTGGTGKTPHVEYLIRLLKDNLQIATLSRGYGRKTPGFQQATKNSNAIQIGDEPLQFYNKFSPSINVFVDAKRVNGVINALQKEPDTGLIILDDAFQHRAIKAGLSILLTDYKSPFYNDFILPVGNLRESAKQKQRADIIIVSKCPQNLSKSEQKIIQEKIKPEKTQKVYFSYIKYGEILCLKKKTTLNISDLKEFKVLLLTGIANPKPLLKELKNKDVNYKHLSFPDHHNYRPKDISNIINIFESLSGENKIILTTEKDVVRIKHIKELGLLPIYYIEIKINFLTDQNQFDQQILNYVKQNKRDC